MKALFILFFISFSLLISAQAPLKISYQGVARNSGGTVIANQQIAVKFDIHQGSATGTVVFTEQYTGGSGLTTNAFGLFTTYIGSVNNLGVINWANGPFFIEVFIDPANGTAYNSLGSQQLMSVPFALYAQTSGNSSVNPTITINAPNTVLNQSTGIYDISVPNPTLSLNSNSLSISNGNTVILPIATTYSAGNGIDITGGIISNTLVPVTPTISGAGSTSVSGTYPNLTISSPAVQTYSAGNGIDITGGVISNTLLPVTPTITGVGSTSVSGTYPNLTISSPAVQTYSAGNGIDITGGVISNTTTVSLLGINAATVTGAYPNFTVNVPNSTMLPNAFNGQLLFHNGVIWDTIPRQKLFFDGNNVGIGTASPQTNFHVVGGGRFDSHVSTPQVFTDNIKITGGTSGQVLTSDALGNGTWQTTNLNYNTSTNELALLQGTTTVATATLNGTGSNTVSITGAGMASVNPTTGSSFTVSVPNPTLSVNSGSISISNGNSVAIPSSSTTLVQGNNVTLNQLGNTYTVSVPSPSFTTNGPTSISGSYPNYTVNSVTSPSTTLVQGNNVTLSQSGNTYTVNAANAYLTSNSNTLTLTSGTVVTTATVPVAPTYTAGTGISISSGTIINTAPGITPTISGTGNAFVTPSGSTFTVNVPTQTLSVTGNSVISSNLGGSATITPASLSYTPATNTVKLTDGLSSNTFTLNNYVAGTGISVSGSAPNYTINNNSPAITPTIIGTGIASVTPSGNTFTVNVPSPSYTSTTGILSFGGTNTIVVTPTLALSGTTLTSGALTNSVNLSSLNGIYGGSGSIPTGSTTVSIGTNTLNFVAANNSKPIANFVGNGTVQPSLLGVANATTGASGIRFIGSYTTTPINYGQIIGGASGVTIGAGTFLSALSTSTNGNVLVNTASDVQGRFQVSQTSSTVNPHVNIISPTGANYGRFKYSNTGNASYFSNEAVSMDGDLGNSAWSVSHYNGSGKEFPVLLINGQRMTYINALNFPLTTFHVMTSTATASGGITSEGFAQAGQINLVRNNNAGTGIRTQVLSGEEIGKINFAGHDGSGFGDGAKIYARASETITSSNKGTELFFAAVPTGTNQIKDVFKINNVGKLEVITGIKIPTGAVDGNVLTSDAFGNASWQPISGASAAWTSTAGVTSLVNPSDQVGIGTNSPFTAVHVKSEASYPYMLLETSANHGGFISANNGGSTLSSPTSNTVNMVLGGFGFGGYNVTANGPSAVMSASTRENWNTGSNGTAFYFETTENGSTGLFKRMMIDHNGNVGIKSDIQDSFTPLSALHVETDGSLDKGLRIANSSSITNGPSIYLDGQNQDWTITGANSGNGSGANKFVIRDYSNSADRFVIDNTGKVGIGLVSPSAMLSVANTFSASEGVFIDNNNNWNGLRVYQGGSGDGIMSHMGNSSSSGNAFNGLSNTSGSVFLGQNTGSGSVADLSISNASNSTHVLNASTTGSGRAIGALANSGYAIYAANTSSTNATIFAENSGISNTAFFNATHGVAIYAKNTSTLNNSVVEIDSRGNGVAMQVYKSAGATGSVATFNNTSSTNGSDAVLISNSGPANSLYVSKPAGANSGSAARIEILNSANSADAVFVSNLGKGAAIRAVSGPANTGDLNASLVLEEGHLLVKQATNGTVSSSLNNMAIDFAATDIAGAFITNNTAIINNTAAETISFTFNKPYTVPPFVIISPASDLFARFNSFVATVTTTGFMITYVNRLGTNYSINSGTKAFIYQVIGRE